MMDEDQQISVTFEIPISSSSSKQTGRTSGDSSPPQSPVVDVPAGDMYEEFTFTLPIPPLNSEPVTVTVEVEPPPHLTCTESSRELWDMNPIQPHDPNQIEQDSATNGKHQQNSRELDTKEDIKEAENKVDTEFTTYLYSEAPVFDTKVKLIGGGSCIELAPSQPEIAEFTLFLDQNDNYSDSLPSSTRSSSIESVIDLFKRNNLDDSAFPSTRSSSIDSVVDLFKRNTDNIRAAKPSSLTEVIDKCLREKISSIQSQKEDADSKESLQDTASLTQCRTAQFQDSSCEEPDKEECLDGDIGTTKVYLIPLFYNTNILL